MVIFCLGMPQAIFTSPSLLVDPITIVAPSPFRSELEASFPSSFLGRENFRFYNQTGAKIRNRYWAVTKRKSAGIQSKPYWILLSELERKAAFAAAKQLSSPHVK
jgi:hypothetical protein